MFCFSMDSERLPSFDVTEFYIVLLSKKNDLLSWFSGRLRFAEPLSFYWP